MKYALTIDKNNENNNQFMLYDDNDIKLKSFRIKQIEKLSKFKDHSWEIEIKAKKCFRFKGVTENENHRIYDTMNKIINQNIDEVIESFSRDQDDDEESETKLWSLKIDPELTSPQLLKKFSLDDVYILKIDNDKIVLENKSNTINFIVIPFNVIRRFGNTDFCLGIELGRSSPIGSGVIALKSKNYHSKHLYKSLREHLGDVLYRLAFNRPGNELNDASGSESDSNLSWVPNMLNNQSGNNENQSALIENSFNLEADNNHLLKSPNSLSLVENQKPLILQKKRVNFLNQLESETDESDYQDKYVPKYMSNKRMLSPSDEFFVDEDNSVYGRVKL
ncbi:hypothetical protein BpHYR1_001950 [Brachionus plicatilis]|uniref:IRS-type PTB domain-containing protein n=1 Tax=Brachionus plicatilis TaxID=10195 RepID=A0A3M7RU22_BRAPC|nr:hypothetical protein BpHYR1_001950 [Brachionus plicatilis]